MLQSLQEKSIEFFYGPFLALVRARPDLHEHIISPVLTAFQDVCVGEDDSEVLERATLLVRVFVVLHEDELQERRIQVHSCSMPFRLSFMCQCLFLKAFDCSSFLQTKYLRVGDLLRRQWKVMANGAVCMCF